MKTLLKNEIVAIKKETPLIGGKRFIVEDKASIVFGNDKWILNYFNPTILQYLLTHKHDAKIDENKDVYYGHEELSNLGYLINIDEVENSAK